MEVIEQENENGGLSPRIRDIKDFCNKTTAHGLSRLSEAKSWQAKIFWILAFLTALVAAIFHISLSLKRFFQYPIQTDIDLIIQEKLILPAVTVCNLNPIKLSKFNSSILDKIIITEPTDTHVGRSHLKEKLYYTLVENNEVVWKAGHQEDELIVNCELPEGHGTCSHLNFSRLSDANYGNCYTLDLNYLSVKQAGQRHGLFLTLFVDVDEYILHLADSVGALVTVHSPYFASRDLDKSPIFVAPGTAVSVALSVACLKHCLAQRMAKDCGCVSIGLIRVAQKLNIKLCNPFNKTQTYCLAESHRNIKIDACFCPPACLEINFLQTVSSSTWPSKTQMPKILLSLNKTGKKAAKVVKNLETARENMALVNIHYDTMTVTHIKQTPAMECYTLLGDIGGQLGLFIGVSFITLIEFLSLIWRLVKPTKSSNEVRAFNSSLDKNDSQMA